MFTKISFNANFNLNKRVNNNNNNNNNNFNINKKGILLKQKNKNIHKNVNFNDVNNIISYSNIKRNNNHFKTLNNFRNKLNLDDNIKYSSIISNIKRTTKKKTLYNPHMPSLRNFLNNQKKYNKFTSSVMKNKSINKKIFKQNNNINKIDNINKINNNNIEKDNINNNDNNNNINENNENKNEINNENLEINNINNKLIDSFIEDESSDNNVNQNIINHSQEINLKQNLKFSNELEMQLLLDYFGEKNFPQIKNDINEIEFLKNKIESSKKMINYIKNQIENENNENKFSYIKEISESKLMSEFLELKKNYNNKIKKYKDIIKKLKIEIINQKKKDKK